MNEVRKILILKFDGLAQFVLSLAAMRRLREAYPKARITLLTSPMFEALANASPYFNEVGALDIVNPLKLARAIRAERFDWVFDLDSNTRTAAIRRLTWPHRVNWSSTPKIEGTHLLERQAAQLKVAGVWADVALAAGEAPAPDISWVLRKFPQPSGDNRAKPYVILLPGGEGARCPVDKFGEAAAQFRRTGHDVIIAGPPGDSTLARQIQRFDAKARDLTGRTDYSTLAALGARSALGIGNECGLLHLVAAAGAPALALYEAGADILSIAPRGHVAVLEAAPLSSLPVEHVLRAAANLSPPLAISA